MADVRRMRQLRAQGAFTWLAFLEDAHEDEDVLASRQALRHAAAQRRAEAAVAAG